VALLPGSLLHVNKNGGKLNIGIHSGDNGLVVNPIKGNSNVRSSCTDEAVRLTAPIKLTLESAVEF